MFVELIDWGTRVGRDFGRGRLLPGRGFRLGIIRVESVLLCVLSTCDACVCVRVQKPTRPTLMTICAANCRCTLAAGNSKLL